ncbi:MAG: thioredoxin domain-containing protein [Elusimicrobiaceae bacterium]|nr:thioredoxin domain-containing protein [Elusimicrobiota bacterium]
MLKKLLVLTLAFVGFAGASAYAEQKQPLEAALFTAPWCGHCQRLKKEYLNEFKTLYKDTVKLVEYDVSQAGVNIIFNDTLAEYNVESAGVPCLVVGESVLMGYPDEIKTGADAAIHKALDNNERTYFGTKAYIAECKANIQNAAAEEEASCENNQIAPGVSKEETLNMFEQITFWAIIAAGLIDGINPCAFAVIVFFVSFLAVYKYDRKEVLLVGAAYCLAVFLAYIAIGLGLFNFLYAMSSFYYVMMIFKWLTIALCALFLLLSLYDFLIYQKTKDHNKILLQLPKSYKEYIHKVMRFFLRDKQKSTFRLVLAALAVGFIVSLVEAVCTGQVYLPTIALILKEADAHFIRAILYLVLYNLMFIVPLVIILALSVMGYESKGFNDFLKKHLGLTKLALCLLFLGLLILLLMNM